MSRQKALITLIEASEKKEFDKIVKVYLKEILEQDTVIITDGSNDIGIDIKTFNINKQHVQYQLTTQKSHTPTEKKQFESKIREDLKKASINSSEFGYSSTLYFFYSYELTNKTIREFERIALLEYEINLTIVDANRIAQEAEEYHELQRTIFSINGLDELVTNQNFFPNEEKNLIFDLVGLGKPTEFRMQIVEAFILQSLFEQNELTKEEIITCCKEKFKTDDNPVFYNKLIQRLQSNRQIEYNDSKSHFKLKKSEWDRINSLIEQYEIDENFFVSSVSKILEDFKQEAEIEQYIFFLKKIYIDNFNSDIPSDLSNRESYDFNALPKDFNTFIHKALTPEEAKNLSIRLFKLCQENNFLQKFCAGKVFSEKTNLSKLENYINTQKRIFIDTQIAIHALCYYFKPTITYNNYFFETTRSLIEYCKKSDITLYIPDRYIWETDTHIQEAFNLIPFTKLPNFSKLGRSRNAFYNYYLNLIQLNDYRELTFVDFFKKFGLTLNDNYKYRQNTIEASLSNIGLKKIAIDKHYEIEDATRVIEIELMASRKMKTKFGLNNDAIILEFLSDKDLDIHPMQPIFCTWDKSFFNLQAKYFSRFPLKQKWYLFTPSRLIDNFSLLNFSIDSESITRELIALLSNEIIQSTHTLLDSIITILNPDDEVGLEYTNRLSDIRDTEIHKIQQNEIMPPEDFEGEALIDDVFFKLSKHYEDAKKKDDFVKVFTHKEQINNVINLLEQSVSTFYQHKKFDDTIFEEFDKIIAKINVQGSA